MNHQHGVLKWNPGGQETCSDRLWSLLGTCHHAALKTTLDLLQLLPSVMRWDFSLCWCSFDIFESSNVWTDSFHSSFKLIAYIWMYQTWVFILFTKYGVSFSITLWYMHNFNTFAQQSHLYVGGLWIRKTMLQRCQRPSICRAVLLYLCGVGTARKMSFPSYFIARLIRFVFSFLSYRYWKLYIYKCDVETL